MHSGPDAAAVVREALRRDDVDLSSGPLGEHWHRPRELLVHAADYGSVEDSGSVAASLSRWGAEERPLPPALKARGFPVRRFAVNLPSPDDLVRVLRQPTTTGPEPRVSLNHLMGAHKPIPMNPLKASVGRPEPIPANSVPVGTPGEPGTAVRVGVIDTGFAAEGAGLPTWAAGRVQLRPGGVDRDPLDTNPTDGRLDHADGHGTFVTSLVLQAAPHASVVCRRVLDSGIADELTVAEAMLDLREAGCTILNLSFGGYTLDDAPPVAMTAALDMISADQRAGFGRNNTVVVAAAGNYGRRRIVWPAAHDDVLAVAALEADSSDGTQASGVPDWTDRGWWVDACTQGVDLRGYFVTFTESGKGGEQFTGAARWSGTSFATAWLSGQIAHALSGRPPGTPVRQVAAELLAQGPFIPELGYRVAGQQ